MLGSRAAATTKAIWLSYPGCPCRGKEEAWKGKGQEILPVGQAIALHLGLLLTANKSQKYQCSCALIRAFCHNKARKRRSEVGKAGHHLRVRYCWHCPCAMQRLSESSDHRELRVARTPCNLHASSARCTPLQVGSTLTTHIRLLTYSLLAHVHDHGKFCIIFRHLQLYQALKAIKKLSEPFLPGRVAAPKL